MTSKYDAIVIGGGHNGLTAAVTLASSGKRVVVAEQNELGGLCAATEFGSGSYSLGTLADTSLLRGRVIDALNLKKFGLEFQKKIPAIFVPQKRDQGEGLNLHYDPVEAQDELAKLSSSDAAAYRGYRAFIGRVRPLFQKIFDAPAPDLASMSVPGLWDIMKKAVSLRLLGRRDMMEVLRMGPMCVADWVGEWFENELLRTCLSAPAVYGTWCGPWSPSTNANLVIYEAMRGRPLMGGAPAVTKALVNAAKFHNVTLLTGRKVTRILTANDRAVGVQLEGAETLEAPVICSSLNPKTSILDLVAHNYIDTKFELRLQHYRMRGTTSIMHLEMDEPLSFDCRPDLKPQHIRICESIDDLERAFDAVKYGQFSKKPALEIMTNPVAGNNGKYVAHVAIHFTPYELKGGWSDASRAALEETTKNRISEYSSQFKTMLTSTRLLTPVDIEAEFSLVGGHLHHGEHAPDQILVRPTLESANYKTPLAGLFLCGSGAHPGGGITCGPGFYGAKASHA